MKLSRLLALYGTGLTGPRLAAMRRLARWTQKDLARISGVHVQTVKYWERQPSMIYGRAPRIFLDRLAAKRITPASVEKALPHLKPDGTCGARTRQRSACRSAPMPGKRRCRLHGGMSTGPTTPEGRQRISRAQQARWQAHRAPPAVSQGKVLGE